MPDTHPASALLLTSLLIRANEMSRAWLVYQQLTGAELLPRSEAAALAQYAIELPEWNLDDKVNRNLIQNALGMIHVTELRTGEDEFEYLLATLGRKGGLASPLWAHIKESIGSIAVSAEPQVQTSLSSGLHVVDMVSWTLGISPQDFTLSTNLAHNSGFELFNEMLQAPEGWTYVPLSRQNRYATGFQSANSAAFSSWMDAQDQETEDASLRISGFAVDQESELGTASAGIWHPAIEFTPGEQYLLYLRYRTRNMDDNMVEVWLEPDRAFRLPASEDEWSEIIYVERATTDRTMIKPLLRSLGEGDLWLDTFSVHTLDMIADTETVVPTPSLAVRKVHEAPSPP